MNLDYLCSSWLLAKEDETLAVARRRRLEDEIHERLKAAHDNLGKTGADTGRHKIRVTERMNRKIDVDLLQEIAAEHGLEGHLETLFRWKPELNVKAWQQADDSITLPLSGAITTKPGRPSFSIEEL
jgi:predicted DNA-binding protein